MNTDIFKRLKDEQIIPVSKLLLLLLRNNNKAGMLFTDIRREIGVSPAMLSQTITELQRQGLVEVQTPMRRQSTKKLYLTDEGERRADNVWECLSALLAIQLSILHRKA